MRRADDPAHETPGSARPYPGLDSLSERAPLPGSPADAQLRSGLPPCSSPWP